MSIQIGTMPFYYLGIVVGGMRVPLRYFDVILFTVRTKLSGQKSDLLSLRAQNVLLQSVPMTISRFDNDIEVYDYEQLGSKYHP